MARLYQTLAEAHTGHSAAARLWRKTAREEENHAAQFSLIIDAIPETVVKASIDVRSLESLRSAVEATTEEFHRNLPSIRDALVATLHFEETMDRIHAHKALVFTEPRVQRMFGAMMAADRGHVSELRAALQRHGRTEKGR